MCRKTYTLKGGLMATIDYDGESYAKVYDSNNLQIGQFIFEEIDAGAEPYQCIPWLMITNMEIQQQYIRKGLGRKILEHVIDCTGYPIHAGEDDGITREDGSHLTGDGPSFINRMREEGLVIPSRIY